MIKRSKILLNEIPFMGSTSLAKKIGLKEAIVLQQIHEWLEIYESEKDECRYKEGKYWVVNSYDQWLQKLPFRSKEIIRRIFRSLEKLGLVISAKFGKTHRIKYYTINYEVLEKLHIDGEKSTHRCVLSTLQEDCI